MITTQRHMNENDISRIVLLSAIEVHRALGGPGLVRWLLLAILAGFGAVVSGLLLLAQSRSGWIGGAAGLVALVSLWALTGRGRWGRVAGAALPLLVAVGLAGGVALHAYGITDALALGLVAALERVSPSGP